MIRMVSLCTQILPGPGAGLISEGPVLEPQVLLCSEVLSGSLAALRCLEVASEALPSHALQEPGLHQHPAQQELEVP